MVKKLFKNIVEKNFKSAIIYKHAKEGTKSFRITQSLVQRAWNQAKKLKNLPVIILTIPANEKENYVLKCVITKEKK